MFSQAGVIELKVVWSVVLQAVVEARGRTEPGLGRQAVLSHSPRGMNLAGRLLLDTESFSELIVDGIVCVTNAGLGRRHGKDRADANGGQLKCSCAVGR